MEKQYFIRDWEDLAKVVNMSDSHDIVMKEYSAWIKPKIRDTRSHGHYLSTHTFYGGSYKRYNKMLTDSGFNVQLANWDDDMDTQVEFYRNKGYIILDR